MAILHTVILPGKALKDGRHKVRISVSHNGEFRYILTNIIIDSDKEFKNGQIVKRPDASYLNTKLRGLMDKYQRAIDEMEYIEGLTCPELIFELKHADRSKHRTLNSIFEEFMSNAQITEGTKLIYIQAYKCICACIGGATLMENITPTSLIALEKYMIVERRLRPSTVRVWISFLRNLINYAMRCGYVQYRVDPFYKYTLPQSEVRQAWLSVEQIRAIRDYEAPTRTQALVKDIFMLSYYLGGINMVDLTEIDFSKNVTRLRYMRTKTRNRQKLNKYVEFDIPEEAREIIDRRIGNDGRLALTKSQRERNCNCIMQLQLPKIAKALNIPYLIYYSARKSFSQHAFQLGIRESTIDYILGHRVDKSSSSLYHYISVTPEIATEAIKKVLKNLKDSK